MSSFTSLRASREEKNESLQLIPQYAALAVAACFIVTSATTNALYGIQKGDTLASSVVWAAVSVAASGVVAVGTTGLFKALASRSYALAGYILIGLVICGTYSTVAALGSSVGSRLTASLEETTKTKARTDLTKAIVADEAIIVAADLPRPQRTSGEIEAEIGGLLSDTALGDCSKIDGPRTREKCPKVVALKAELAKVKDANEKADAQVKAKDEARERLTTERDSLSKLGAPKAVNSDAKAIAEIAGRLGYEVEPDLVNLWLSILAVLVVELGGSVALAIGLSLGASEGPVRAVSKGESVGESGIELKLTTSEMAEHIENKEENINIESAQEAPQEARPDVRSALLDMLNTHSGSVRGSYADIAEQLGFSKTRVREVVTTMKSEGLVKVRSSGTGTTISLPRLRLVAAA